MKQVLLQIMKDSSKIIPANSKSDWLSNYWFWIAAAEFSLILFLLFKARQKKGEKVHVIQEDVLHNSKEAEIDMDDLMNSIHKSRELYKKLSVKCHPDRFTDSELNSKADLIFQEITKNQRNYKKLLELKETAKNQLNITI